MTIILAGLLLALGGPAGIWVDQAAAATDPAAGKGHNQVLLTASSPFEDMAEQALANNASGMQQALGAYEHQGAAVDKVLAPAARQEVASLVAQIKQAVARGDNQAAARNAVAAYRLLTASLAPLVWRCRSRWRG